MVAEVFDFDRVIPPPDRVRLLEPFLDVRLDVAVVFGSDMQRLSVSFFADLALLDDDPARLDDEARQLEHRLLVRVRRVDRDVGVGPRPEVSLVLQSQDSSRAGPGDDGDLRQRVLAVEARRGRSARAPCAGRS